MSENHDLEREFGGSGAVRYGNQERDRNEIEGSYSEPISYPNGATNLEQDHVSSKELNGLIHSLPNEELEPVPDHKGAMEGADVTVQDDPDDGVGSEGTVREEMFEDCADELGSNADSKEAVASIEIEANYGEEHRGTDAMQESTFQETSNGEVDGELIGEVERIKNMLGKTAGEKEIDAKELKEEREAFARELANFHHQLKILTNQESLLDEYGSGFAANIHKAEVGPGGEKIPVVDIPLKDSMSECSQFLRGALEQRLQMEATVRELHAILYMKDQQIEGLNATVAGFSDRMLASLVPVINQQELLDDSVSGILINVERGTSFLMENYNQMLWEIDQLRQCLSRTGLVNGFQEFGAIFAAARDELLELKGKEMHFVERLNHLEDENRKLLEQIDNDRLMIDSVNKELGKAKTELEQERVRFSNTKEKLTMAVTKGKALVQQRDTLKQSLADKTSELEIYLLELQEKSTALEAAELSKVELVKCENLVVSVQENLSQKSEVVAQFEEILSQVDIPDELQSKDAIQKLRILVGENEKMKGIYIECQKLQENVLQKDAVVAKFEEILSLADVPEGLHSEDIIERLRMLVDENEKMKGVSIEYHKSNHALSSVDLPEIISSSNLESRVGWLRESFFQTRDKLIELKDELARTREAGHKEIDRLSTSFLVEFLEKDFLQSELDSLTCKYKERVEQEYEISLQKDQVVKLLLEASGIAVDDEGVIEASSDFAMLVERCFQKIKEQGREAMDSSHADADSFEKIQSLLYVRDQDLRLCEEILEEEFSEMNGLSNKLRAMSQELLELKEERSSLQKDLERTEDKSSVLREKLSMAVKKGKGLVQDRENMKRRLDEKDSEIEKLKLEFQNQESIVAECRNRIDSLSTDVERIPVLDFDLGAMKNEKDRLEQNIENFKNLLDERDLEVEKLKLEFRNQESAVVECRSQIDRLSADVDRIPTLEADFVAMKDQRDQLEQFLSESNNMLQKVIQSIDGILLPTGTVFEEPVGKLLWLASYINECQDIKTHAEEELSRLKEEEGNLAIKLADAIATVKSLEDTLSDAHRHISQLTEEKREMEESKVNAQEMLQKAINEASSQSSQFSEACSTRNSLEEALSLAENKVSELINEKEEANIARVSVEMELEKMEKEMAVQTNNLAEAHEKIKSLEDALLLAATNIDLLRGQTDEAQAGRVGLETELEKAKEEMTVQTNKLTEAYERIKLLEDALSQMETSVALLREQHDQAQGGRTKLEIKLKRQEEEAESHASKLVDASSTIKSLEDALFKAEGDVSVLDRRRKNAEDEILILKAKLNECMEELSGTSGSVEKRSVQLSGYLNDLQEHMKDETLLTKISRSLEKKFESLKDVDLILKSISDHLVEWGLGDLESQNSLEDSSVIKPFSDANASVDVEKDNSEVFVADGDDSVSLSYRKTLEGFHLRNKILTDKFEGFSHFLDIFIADLSKRLKAMKDRMALAFDQIESLKQKTKDLENFKQEQENSTAILEDDVRRLVDACSVATRELQFEVKNSLLDLSSVPKLENLKNSPLVEMGEFGGAIKHQQRLSDRKHAKTIEELLFETRKVHSLAKHFETSSNIAAATIEDLQNKLEVIRTTSEEAMKEKDLNLMETHVESLKSSCHSLRLQLDDYKAIEEKLKEREAEVSSMHNNVSVKEQEAKESLMSASQMKTLFEKIREIETHTPISEVGTQEIDSSIDVKKLFYIVETFIELQHEINLLLNDKEKLQSTVSTKTLEIEHLRNVVDEGMTYKQDSEKMKNELLEITFSLEKIVSLLGGASFTGDRKSDVVKGLLREVEKQATAVLSESEILKSRSEKLNMKLDGSQKFVEELSAKVQLLEDSLQARTAQPEIIQERSIFEAPSLPSGSEISEIEDAGTLGMNPVASVPSATHVRTLRKGSTDHLTINIGSESDRLIKTNEETDEDKGHVFKSLNSTGLIPKQGKQIADRVDGIWVSGGRVLMSRPGARLGFIAYWLLLHIWLLGTIL